MKRTKHIDAFDHRLKVKVTVQITSVPFHWTRDEINAMAENLASGIMQTMAATRHMQFPLSQIKVSDA